MQKRRMAIVLFCMVSSLVFSSCVKKTLNTAASPIVAAAKAVGFCARTVLNKSGLNCAKKVKIAHTHKKEIRKLPKVDEVPESK